MNTTFAPQAAAFSLAAIVTSVLLVAINGLAGAPAADAVFASVPAAQEQGVVQQVVVVGQRLPRI